ncbi:hypothetical protein [Turicimonas muris]|uniref:hypothetical protein n=1 Tax=Turicimonas muris TaxID=1796652 RepID=UPI002493F9B2|nr:hypothetical protein [Turicimonas muris]
MSSIFFASAGELSALSAKELALRIRSECCVFDLPPIVQVLLQKMEEDPTEYVDAEVRRSCDKAEEISETLDQINDDLVHFRAFFEESLQELDRGEDESDNRLFIEKKDAKQILGEIEDVIGKASGIDPYSIVPDL